MYYTLFYSMFALTSILNYYFSNSNYKKIDLQLF